VPDGRDPDAPAGSGLPQLGIWQRFLLALPRVNHDREKPALGERLRGAILKPPDPDAPPPARPSDGMSLEELGDADRHANDKERAIGLLAAPVAAAIGLIVIDNLIAHDPAGKQHVPVSDYHELIIVLLGLSVVMLATAWFRKRLYLGMVTAVYGLAIFNLKYWGFGVPFVMVGAWLLVRAYRLHRDYREATGGGTSRAGSNGRAGYAPGAPRPQPNKRYTPPPPAARRPASSKRSQSAKRSSSKPDKQQRAG